MRYTVVWIPSAEARLADLWLRAVDRQAVTDSSNRIDCELAENAHTKGVTWGPFRAYFDDPLAVLFIVDPGDCMVEVVQVRRTT